MQNFKKHIQQIKKGGTIIFLKKLKSLISLILQIPIYIISIPTVIVIRLIRPWFLIKWLTALYTKVLYLQQEIMKDKQNLKDKRDISGTVCVSNAYLAYLIGVKCSAYLIRTCPIIFYPGSLCSY
jgi:hypothetical protein|tara:strand:+ start:855 stop:1229 length:375 start_codon:yes stop_codon:yes gene_type:complete